MLEGYKIDKNGVIQQTNPTSINYDEKYIATRYLLYPDKCINMGYLRLGYIIGSLGRIPNNILDVGYGSGDFLKVAQQIVPNCYGYDITGLTPPEGTIKVDDIYKQRYEVVCFFDVLEHFTDIYEIKELKANYICVSLPWCHYYNDEWFNTWKHRRLNEHLFHFNEKSLKLFFKEIGYEMINYSCIEDTIRKDGAKNILTAFFKNVNFQ